MRRFVLRLALCLLAAGGPAFAAEPAVVLVSSETGPAYAQLVEATTAELERVGVARDGVRHMTLADFQEGRAGIEQPVDALTRQ